MRKAVFLDRDGVLIEDSGLITRAADVRLLEGVPEALRLLSSAGYLLIIVSNQAVVARGLLSEGDVIQLEGHVETLLRDAGAPELNGFYFCPHHPNATIPSYRVSCDCRKPCSGLLIRAAREHGIDLGESSMVGDRITDVIAGFRAGCRTYLLETGAHVAAPIETDEPIDWTISPDVRCASLGEAARQIIHRP